MFKKIEIWILYLVVIFSIISTIVFGALVRHEMLGGTGLKKYNLGWISATALFLAEIPSNASSLLLNNDLVVLDRFPQLEGFNGTPNSEELYILLSRYDGDLKEGIVELVDLTSFKTLHTWNPDIDAFNKLVEQVDEFQYIERDNNNQRQMLGHPKLTKDGGLLFRSLLLRKINSCSELVFQNTDNIAHHSIETDIDGNIWVPGRLYPRNLSIDKVGDAHHTYDDDSIVMFSPDGKVIFEKSVTEIFIENGLEYLIFGQGNLFEVDPIHLNDIQPVNYDGDFWNKGDVFLSLRNQSMVLLYRPSTNQVVWKWTGPIFHQHDVNIIDGHRISVFNNNSKIYYGSEEVDGHSQVIIYDFKTNEYSLYLEDDLLKNDVRSTTNGRSHILPNGDLFIEETKSARTLYFNADGSLRWTHLNRSKDRNVYAVEWSRILYTQEDLKAVNNLLKTKSKCYE